MVNDVRGGVDCDAGGEEVTFDEGEVDGCLNWERREEGEGVDCEGGDGDGDGDGDGNGGLEREGVFVFLLNKHCDEREDTVSPLIIIIVDNKY